MKQSPQRNWRDDDYSELHEHKPWTIWTILPPTQFKKQNKDLILMKKKTMRLNGRGKEKSDGSSEAKCQTWTFSILSYSIRSLTVSFFLSKLEGSSCRSGREKSWILQLGLEVVMTGELWLWMRDNNNNTWERKRVRLWMNVMQQGQGQEQEQEQVFACSRKCSSWVPLQYRRCCIYQSSRHAITMAPPATKLIPITTSHLWINLFFFWYAPRVFL